MTRETKLGLVVAGSFLALVGGVVVARLKQVEMPGETVEAAAAAPAEKPPEEKPPEPQKIVKPVPGDAFAQAGNSKMPADDPAPAPAKTPEPEPMAPPPMITPPASPAAAPVEPPSPAVISPPPMTPATPPEPMPPPAPEPMAPTPPAPPSEPMAPAPTPAPMTPAPTPPSPEPMAPAPTPAPTPTPTPPEPAAPTPPAPTTPSPMPVAPIPTPPDPPPASPPAPTIKPAEPTVVKQPDPPAAPPPLNPNVANNAVPTVAVVPASGINGGATLDPPRTPAAPPRDQFTTPTRPAAPPEPRRDSYLEEQYRWKSGDSFAALSTQVYQSPKYADALLKYNQDYPLATREMRQSPPAIAPGQVVWVPPVRILERDYANRISGLTPVVTPTARPTVEPVAPPPGLANSGFGNPAGQFYRVRQPGESVQEIARRTLRNSGFANRIQALNPSLSPDPRLPIPAGTVLRLPPEAQVDAVDKP
jgi:hypothetical protein